LLALRFRFGAFQRVCSVVCSEKYLSLKPKKGFQFFLSAVFLRETQKWLGITGVLGRQ